MLRKGLTIIGVVAFLAIVYWLLRDEFAPAPPPSPMPEASLAEPQPPVAPSPPEAARPAPEPPEREIPVPELAASDPFVRDLLEPLGLPADWTAKDDLVRRLAVLVDNATRSELSHRQLQFLRPKERYRVIERQGRLYPDPRNAARFDRYLDLLESIEPEAAAGLLKTIEPILSVALGELGTTTNAQKALIDAIDRALDAPELPKDAALIRPKVLYKYADPALEGLPPLEKQLMRLGPKNHARMRAYLTDLRQALVDRDGVRVPAE